MGKCLFETGNVKGAMALFQSNFQITQEHVETLIQYCRVLYSLERYEEAFEILLVIFVKQSRKIFKFHF
jgi:tetratricopeptide (TPR) repeat protein